MLLFINQIFKNFLRQKAWPSIWFKKCGRGFHTHVRWTFEALWKHQKLDREFEKFGQVFESESESD